MFGHAGRAAGLLATLMVLAAGAGAVEPGGGPVLLDQGWDVEMRERFYFTPQGSRMIPYSWFKALERADGGGPFADPEHLAGFGLLPAPVSAHNPDGFPIGVTVGPGDAAVLTFAPDPDGLASDARQVGINCAACHTGTVTVEGRPIRIDGGPANFDFDSFYAALAEAVTATQHDDARFARFARAVLGQGSATGAAELRLRFAAFQVRLAGDAVLRRPALASGYGRADALTQIVNSLAVRDLGEPANLHPVAAPTSYPPLWLAPELEFVQWNPIAASPIARNAGQVLGVFGTTQLRPGSETPFASTMMLDELHALEGWVATLTPPAWDEALMGPIDAGLAEEGAAIFAASCAGCHNMPPYRRTAAEENQFGRTFIKIGRVDYRDVGTDPAYVEALSRRMVLTGPLAAPLFGGQQAVSAPAFFLRTVGAAVEAAMAREGLSQEERIALNGFRLRASPSGPRPYEPPSLTDMKASPLAGVWATGPYLHNGSVATVYELLSPPEERRAVFWTGGRELDRERLGFVSEDAPGRFRYDTSLRGNGNQGHAFPRAAMLGHDQRMAVIEYLKTQ